MAHNSGELPQERPVGSGHFFWSDGSEATPAEVQEILDQASGKAPSATPEGQQIDTTARGTGPLDFLLPKQIGSGAPGASLDVAASQESRAPLGDLMAQLQQQAATGSGSWENALRAATDKTKASASAIGQAQANTGGDYASSLMNIGNAQAGAEQRAVGQGNVLREQSKNAAQDQLSGLLQTTGQQDISEATSEAATKQARDETNAQIQADTRNTIMNTAGGVGSALMSKGGPVPGVAKVPGNDEANDTVPTMLSPGEVVLPRTIAHDPEAAADFVRTLNASKQRGSMNMADGGDVPALEYLDEKGDKSGLSTVPLEKLAMGRPIQAPSIENGGLLNDTNARAGHDNMMALSKLMQQRANGQSATPGQMSTNAADDAVGNALGADRRAGASNIMAGTAAAQQGAGGQAAVTAGNEQAGGQNALAGALTGQRANDLGLARAEQQAAWRNTMMNANVSAANQALIARLTAGAAQGFGALSSSGSKPGSGDPFSLGAERGAADSTGGGNDAALLGGAGVGGGFSGAGDNTGGAEPESDWGDGFAFGGAVGMADGGDVESPEMHTLRMQARREGASWAQDDKPVESAEMATLRKQAAKGGAEWAQEKPDTRKRLQDFAKTLSAGASGMVPRKMANGGEAGYPDSAVMPEPFYTPGVAPDAGSVLVPASFQPAVTPAPEERGLLPKGSGIERLMRAPPGFDPVLGPGLSAPMVNARHEAEVAAKPLPKGITAPPVEAPQTPAPAPVVAPKAGVGIGLPKPTDRTALEQQNEATITAAADLEAQKARAEATGLAERQRVAGEYALKEKDTRDRAKMFTDDAFNRLRAAQDDMAKVDAGIDPNRYWANKTTGQKILGVIGLALGAVGAGADGINRAAQMMNHAIDRDIDAQKAEYEARIKKGAARVGQAQSYYSMAREAGLDEVAATHAAKAAALEAVANKTEMTIAGINEPMAKLKGQALINAARGGAADKTDTAKQRTFENRIQLGQLGVAQEVAGRRSGLSEGERKSVGDVTAAARDAVGLIDNIEKTLTRTQSAIPGKTALNQNVGGDAALLDTDVSSLTTKLKDVEKLGAMSADDRALLREAIGDPKAVFTLEATKRAKLSRLKQIVRDSVSNERAARGIQ